MTDVEDKEGEKTVEEDRETAELEVEEIPVTVDDELRCAEEDEII